MSTCDILGNQRIQDVIEMLRAERQDESVWNELYQSALNSAKTQDECCTIPGRRRRRLLQEDRIRYLGGMLTDKQCYVKYVTLLPKP
jgi:hypothetical protein